MKAIQIFLSAFLLLLAGRSLAPAQSEVNPSQATYYIMFADGFRSHRAELKLGKKTWKGELTTEGAHGIAAVTEIALDNTDDAKCSVVVLASDGSRITGETVVKHSGGPYIVIGISNNRIVFEQAHDIPVLYVAPWKPGVAE